MKTTKQRLADYRKESEKYTGLTWRDTRQHHSNLWSTPNNVVRYGKLFSDSVDQIGEYLGDSHTLVKMDDAGWYCDHNQDGLLIGGVCRLRCAKHTMYIPVTRSTDWDGTAHYFCDMVTVTRGSSEDDHSEAIREAARYADRCAEIEAEENRECAAKDAAEQDIEQARETIHNINVQCLALLREIRQYGAYSVAVCSALRAQVQTMLQDRARAFKTIAARQDDYWSAVSY